MDKYGLVKDFKLLYQPSAKEVIQLDVPSMNFLMIDGSGDPNTSQEYQETVQILYSLSYTLKFMVKKGPRAIDYGVMPLEGLWWADDMSAFSASRKSDWKWTMMIMQPDIVTERMVADATPVVIKKGLDAAKARFESFHEGLCAQILHIGPFSAEGPTIEKVHSFIDERGRHRGKHHEIYMSDIRKADPSKWKTVIRQPMEIST